MRKTRLAAIAGLVVITTGAVVDASQIRLLAELDNHAWTLERTAIRADRDVRYEFRHAPVAGCLRKHFCFIVEKADDLQRTIGRKVDPGELRDIEDCLNEIDEHLEEVLVASDRLRSWAAKCKPVVQRYGSVRIESCAAGASDRDLQRLCDRIDLLRSTLKCMFETLDKLFCECGITRPHVHGRQHAASGRSGVNTRQTAPGAGRLPAGSPQSSRRTPHRFVLPHRTVSVPIGSSSSRFRLSFVFD